MKTQYSTSFVVIMTDKDLKSDVKDIEDISDDDDSEEESDNDLMIRRINKMLTRIRDDVVLFDIHEFIKNIFKERKKKMKKIEKIVKEEKKCRIR